MADCGPDRRFRKGPPPEDVGERRADGFAVDEICDRAGDVNGKHDADDGELSLRKV